MLRGGVSVSPFRRRATAARDFDGGDVGDVDDRGGLRRVTPRTQAVPVSWT